jgi:hypothetical protein
MLLTKFIGRRIAEAARERRRSAGGAAAAVPGVAAGRGRGDPEGAGGDGQARVGGAGAVTGGDTADGVAGVLHVGGARDALLDAGLHDLDPLDVAALGAAAHGRAVGCRPPSARRCRGRPRSGGSRCAGRS